MLLRVLPVLLMVTVTAADATSRVDVTGDYTSNWDDVKLVQEGNEVHGTYVCCGGGTIDGHIYEGRVVRYHWRQAGGAEGEGVWEIMSADRLEGTWGTEQSDDDGGRWDLVRKLSVAN